VSDAVEWLSDRAALDAVARVGRARPGPFGRAGWYGAMFDAPAPGELGIGVVHRAASRRRRERRPARIGRGPC